MLVEVQQQPPHPRPTVVTHLCMHSQRQLSEISALFPPLFLLPSFSFGDEGDPQLAQVDLKLVVFLSQSSERRAYMHETLCPANTTHSSLLRLSPSPRPLAFGLPQRFKCEDMRHRGGQEQKLG